MSRVIKISPAPEVLIESPPTQITPIIHISDEEQQQTDREEQPSDEEQKKKVHVDPAQRIQPVSDKGQSEHKVHKYKSAQRIQAITRGRLARSKSIEIKMKAMSQSLLTLQKKINALENTKPVGETKIIPPHKRENDTLLPQQGYELSPSIWDMVLLLYTEEVGNASSIYSTCLILAALAIQSIFCFIVLTSFTKETFDDTRILGFRSWRRNIAHSTDFMDKITEVSLASRVCNNDSGLELSGTQSDYHELLGDYINGGGLEMCILTVLMWLLTIVREFSSVISFFKAVGMVPRGCATIISKGGASFESITKVRYVVVIIMTLFRVWVLFTLGYSGVAWLTNTVSVTRLVLSAVSLQFMLYIDELIFEALAPGKLKRVMERFASSPMPMAPLTEWRGLDAKAITLSSILFCAVIIIWQLMVIPFESRLKLADDALCAGELEFVYTVGKTGVPAWSESSVFENPVNGNNNAKSYGSGSWNSADPIIEKDKDGLTFVMAVVDNLINGYGISKFGSKEGSNETCGEPVYFRKENQTVPAPYCDVSQGNTPCQVTFCEAQYYIGLIDINGNNIVTYPDEDLFCCISAQIITPNIIGGKFSLNFINSETTSSSTDVWNAGCIDLLGRVDNSDDEDGIIFSFYNLLAGALSDVFGGECGICPSLSPYCDPVSNKCTNITCSDLTDYCYEDSTEGVRARQFCPVTCGCNNPSDQLVLTSSAYGCPQNCADFAPYDNSVSTQECVDEVIGSNRTADYVNEVTRISSTWPAFWQAQWLNSLAPYLIAYGCSAVSSFKIGESLPMDACVEGGTMWPIKPMSHLCPVACGCSSKMIWGCPSSCSVNATTTT